MEIGAVAEATLDSEIIVSISLWIIVDGCGGFICDPFLSSVVELL